MRIRNTLMLLLVAVTEISCINVAEEYVNHLQINKSYEVTHYESTFTSTYSSNWTQSVNLDTIENIVRGQCQKHAGPVASNAVKESFKNLPICIQSFVDIPNLAAEIFAARLKGDVDVMSKKYCSKVPILKKCVKNVTDRIEPCLIPEQQESADIMFNVINVFLKILCDNEGDRLTTFVLVDGPECLASQQQAVKDCAMQSFSSYISKLHDVVADTPGRDNISFTISTEECAVLHKFQKCTVAVLERCNDPTPANMVDFFLEYISKKLCERLAEKEKTPEIVTTAIPEVQVPNREEWHDTILEEKCVMNGGRTAYEDAKEAVMFVAKCVRCLGVQDIPQIVHEIIAVRSKSSLDKIIKNYCRRVPILIELEKYMSDSIKACLDPEEQKSSEIFQDIGHSLLEFICYNEGVRISTLIANGGIPCLVSKKQGMLDCSNEIFSSYKSATRFNGSGQFPRYILGEKQCTELEKFQECSVKLLAECENETPLNLLKSIFDAIHEKAPCRSWQTTATTEIIPLPDNQHPRVPNLVNVSLEIINIYNQDKERIDQINGFLEETCPKISGHAVQDSAKEIKRSLDSLNHLLRLNTMDINNKILEAELVGNLESFFKEHCHEVSAFEEYLKHVADFLKTCVRLEERAAFDITYKIISSSMQFICQNEGSNLTSFVAENGARCLSPKVGVMLSCLKKSSVSNILDPGSVKHSVNGSERFDILYILDAEDCADLDKLQDCSFKLLAGCVYEESLDQLNSMFDTVRNEVSCGSSQTTTTTEITSPTTIAPEITSRPDDQHRCISNPDNVTGSEGSVCNDDERNDLNDTYKEITRFLLDLIQHLIKVHNSLDRVYHRHGRFNDFHETILVPNTGSTTSDMSKAIPRYSSNLNEYFIDISHSIAKIYVLHERSCTRIQIFLEKISPKSIADNAILHEAAMNITRTLSDIQQITRLSMYNVAYEIIQSRSQRGLIDYFKHYSHEVPTINKYLKHVAEFLKTCVKPDQRVGFDIDYHIASSALEFISQDEGHRVATLIATNGLKSSLQCFIIKVDAVINSFNVSGRRKKLMIERTSPRMFQHRSVLSRNCENSMTADFVESLIKHVLTKFLGQDAVANELDFDGNTRYKLDQYSTKFIYH